MTCSMCGVREQDISCIAHIATREQASDAQMAKHAGQGEPEPRRATGRRPLRFKGGRSATGRDSEPGTAPIGVSRTCWSRPRAI
jgi:hypothetical protein